MPEIGVAIPVYNAAATVEHVVAQVHGALDGVGLTHRIALVDDGSTDGSWEVLRTLAQRDGRLRCVRLARNCGQQGALLCALGELRGCAMWPQWMTTWGTGLHAAQHAPQAAGRGMSWCTPCLRAKRALLCGERGAG